MRGVVEEGGSVRGEKNGGAWSEPGLGEGWKGCSSTYVAMLDVLTTTGQRLCVYCGVSRGPDRESLARVDRYCEQGDITSYVRPVPACD